MFHECYFYVAMGFRPSQQVFQSCRDETTDSLMLHSSMEEIKVSCVWAQHGEGRYFLDPDPLSSKYKAPHSPDAC